MFWWNNQDYKLNLVEIWWKYVLESEKSEAGSIVFCWIWLPCKFTVPPLQQSLWLQTLLQWLEGEEGGPHEPLMGEVKPRENYPRFAFKMPQISLRNLTICKCELLFLPCMLYTSSRETQMRFGSNQQHHTRTRTGRPAEPHGKGLLEHARVTWILCEKPGVGFGRHTHIFSPWKALGPCRTLSQLDVRFNPFLFSLLFCLLFFPLSFFFSSA